MKLGDTIKRLRKESSIPQKEFAQRCGITNTYLSLIENNRRPPGPKLLQRIAENLEVPVPIIYFLSIENEDIPDSKKESFKILGAPIKAMFEKLFTS